MKTYTTDQTIDLFDEYMEECSSSNPDGLTFNKSFDKWLKNKEKSELPVKDQIIWVRDKLPHGGYTGWVDEMFSHFVDNKIVCFTSEHKTHIADWDEYSLTDPNEI